MKPTDEEYTNHHSFLKGETTVKSSLSKEQIETLEKWTSLTIDSILFDTKTDDWSDYTCQLNERIFGKKQLLFLLESKKGDLFGYYFNPTIEMLYNQEIYADEKTFHFSLFSNGRIAIPMKCEILYNENSGIIIKKKNSFVMINIGDISAFKEEDRDKSICWQHDEIFNYHGFEKILCGEMRQFKNGWFGKTFVLKRMIVIQMI